MLLGLSKKTNKLKPLSLEKTKNTPRVEFDPGTGRMDISGVSVPEDAKHFYLPVYNWIMEYSNDPAESPEMHVELHYFNTTTSTILLNLFKEVKKIPGARIVWHYESDDMDMEEVGNDYKLLIGSAFELKEVS